MMKPLEANMDLLEKRNQSLHDSHERTKRIYEKAAKLGLIEVYKDFHGQLKTRKTINHKSISNET